MAGCAPAPSAAPTDGSPSAAASAPLGSGGDHREVELLASAAGLRFSGYSPYERVGFVVSAELPNHCVMHVYRRLT